MTAATPVTVLARFLALWERSASDCWLWTGAQVGPGYDKGEGYAGFWNGRRYDRAHRVSYRLFVGPIPEGMELDHLCFVRHCVNPAHLEPVTRDENMRRAPRANGNKTHCLNGHPYDEKNTYRHVRSQGGLQRKSRTCRACAAAYQRRLRARRKEQS